MRVLYIVFFAGCLALVAYFMTSTYSALGPEPVAAELFQDIKLKRLEQAATLFGNAKCTCPPAGGYISYFKYDSGHEPNLAFLVGQDFQVGPMSKLALQEHLPYLLPWERPQIYSISVPLHFSPEIYSPYLLPLPMAFDESMPAAQFLQFTNNPSLDTRGLSLRLRPTIQAGLIPKAAAEQAKQRGMHLYVTPGDAGQIIGLTGKILPAEQVEAQLPRLQSIVLNLKVSRRGIMQPWQINDMRFSSAVVQAAGQKQVKLSESGAH